MKYKHFGGLPAQSAKPESSKVVIIPAPFESTNAWIKGAEKGPESILEASGQMELYDIATDKEVYKAGIFTMEHLREKRSAEKLAKEMEQKVKEWLKKKKFPVIIGGEHSVSIGAFKAFADYYKGDLTILQLDAHLDLKKTHQGSKYNERCVMTHALELAPVLHAGVRSMAAEERDAMEPDRVFYADYILNNSNTSWMYDLLNKLAKNVYITIDLDVLDTAIMPSTGSPEPGGLPWNQLLDIIEKVNNKTNIVGFDVTGLVPMKYNKAPNVLAAKLIYQIISYKFASGLK